MKNPTARHRSLPLTAAAFALLLGTVSAAHAQTTIDPERKYTYADGQAIINLGTTYDGTGAGGLRSAYAGAQATMLLTGGDGLLPPTFDAYCVQIGVAIQRPSQTVTLAPMDSTFRLGKASINPGGDYGGAISWLYSHYAPLAADQTQNSAQQSAALQLSIWAVEYNWDGTGLNGIDPTLQTGNFTYLGNPTQTSPTIQYNPVITQAIRDNATVMLTTWNGQTDDTSSTFLDGRVVSGGSGGQSLVGPKVVRAVPEPGSLALLAGSPLALGLAGIRRRTRR